MDKHSISNSYVIADDIRMIVNTRDTDTIVPTTVTYDNIDYNK